MNPNISNEQEVLNFLKELGTLEEGEEDPLAGFFAMLAGEMERRMEEEDFKFSNEFYKDMKRGGEPTQAQQTPSQHTPENKKFSRIMSEEEKRRQNPNDELDLVKLIAELAAEEGYADLAQEYGQAVKQMEMEQQQKQFAFKDKDDLQEFMVRMGKNKDGTECPGAFDPMFMLWENGLNGELRALDEMGIRGTDLYGLWNDCSRRNPTKFLQHMWLLASGQFSQGDLEANFASQRPNAGKALRELDAYRTHSIPFICEALDINKFCPGLEQGGEVKIDDEGYQKYAKANAEIFRIKIFCMRNNLQIPKIEEIVGGIGNARIELADKKGNTKEYRKSFINDIIGGGGKFYEHINSRMDLELIDKWMDVSKRKHMPALPIIRKIPLENAHIYFDNNNHVRLEQLKQEYGINTYEGMEGLVAIAHTLGLFDANGKQSEKAQKYIREYFIGRKIPDEIVHRLYGHIDLSQAFNKDFAEFFMQHHSQNKDAFVNEEGIDMASTLCANFDKVLKFRPEKKIKTKTRSQILTPRDAMSVFGNTALDLLRLIELANENIDTANPEQLIKNLASENASMTSIDQIKDMIQLFKKVDLRDDKYEGMKLEKLLEVFGGQGISKSDIERAYNLQQLGKTDDPKHKELIALLSKYGATVPELMWAIELNNQAREIKEEDVKIPFVTDKKNGLITFESLKKIDPRIYLSGKKTNSCSHYGGHAQDRLKRVVVDPLSRMVILGSNQSYFDGLVWYDPDTAVACIDNIEGQFLGADAKNENAPKELLDATIRYSDAIFTEMKKRKIPLTRVNLGKGQPMSLQGIFSAAETAKTIKSDPHPSTWPSRNGITTDAGEQYTITSPEILNERGLQHG